MNDEKPPTTIEEAFANLDRILATMPAAKQRASQGNAVLTWMKVEDLTVKLSPHFQPSTEPKTKPQPRRGWGY